MDTTRHTTARIGPWTVRIVWKGERYGLNNVIEHAEDMPLVEFYDAEQSLTKFGPWGQFVSRYGMPTILTRDRPGMPLCLHGGVPRWTVSAEHMALVERWLEAQCAYVNAD